MKLSLVAFRFEQRQWIMDVKREPKKKGRALAEHLTREEFHGDLQRNIMGAKRYLTEEDKVPFNKLYQAMVHAIRAFRDANTYQFATDKVEWKVDGAYGQHVVRTNKNHGAVSMTLTLQSTHGLSKSSTVTATTMPGNHAQAAMGMLSSDVGEMVADNPEITVEDVADYIIQRADAIAHAMSIAVPANYDTEVGDGEADREEAVAA